MRALILIFALLLSSTACAHADVYVPGTPRTDVIPVIINGGGATIATGIAADIPVPYNCTITSVTLEGDQTGSIVLDIWRDTYANFPPTVADTITAAAKPTISSDVKSTDSTLTGWSKTLTAGQSLRINVDSVTSMQRCLLFLGVTRN